jgi:hypothetical protein
MLKNFHKPAEWIVHLINRAIIVVYKMLNYADCVFNGTPHVHLVEVFIVPIIDDVDA